MTDPVHEPENGSGPGPRPPRGFWGCLGLLLLLGMLGVALGLRRWWLDGTPIDYRLAVLALYLGPYFACMWGLYHLKKWGYQGLLLLYLLNWIYNYTTLDSRYAPIEALLLVLLVHIGHPRPHTLLN